LGEPARKPIWSGVIEVDRLCALTVVDQGTPSGGRAKSHDVELFFVIRK
jgi:hypothetical protein